MRKRYNTPHRSRVVKTRMTEEDADVVELLHPDNRHPHKTTERAILTFWSIIIYTSSYYKVVVIRVPLQGQNATIDKVLWIGLNLLPQDGFGKAPTTALCF